MNNVLPGWIGSLPATEARRESVPMRRYGTSVEIAATIAFLASDARLTSPARISASMAG
jgi:NAD(P)-dependent dehydrogenase (short-subunit alcohol dehydrogenase family)